MRTMTKPARAAAYNAANGECHVCGEHCPPLGSWSVVREDTYTNSKPGELIEENRLLCPTCNNLRRGGDLGTLRQLIADNVTAAKATMHKYGPLTVTGIVTFHGERDQVDGVGFEETPAEVVPS